MRTVTCKCIDCGKHFQSILTIANVCHECMDVSVTFHNKDDEYKEYYVTLPRKEAKAKAEELSAEGHMRIVIKDAICEAF